MGRNVPVSPPRVPVFRASYPENRLVIAFAAGTIAEEIKLLIGKLVTCLFLHLIRKVKKHFIVYIFNFSTIYASNMRMLIYICVIPEFIFPYIEFLNQPKLLEYLKGLIYRCQAHCGIYRLKLAVQHVNTRMFFCILQYVVNGYTLGSNL